MFNAVIRLTLLLDFGVACILLNTRSGLCQLAEHVHWLACILHHHHVSVVVTTVYKWDRRNAPLIGNDPESQITKQIGRARNASIHGASRGRHAKIRRNTRSKCRCGIIEPISARTCRRARKISTRLDEAAEYVGKSEARNCTSASERRPLAVFRLLWRCWRKVWS